MAIETVREILGWCTVLNFAMFFVSVVVMTVARGWVYKMHGDWWRISEQQFNVTIYGFLGLYKVMIIVFNLVPYVAVVIAMR